MKKLLALILTLIMALSMVTVTNAAKLENNLVAHWSFDDVTATSTTTADVSGNGYDLSIVDTTFTPIEGFYGKTLYFSTQSAKSIRTQLTGDDFVSFANKLNGKAGLTVSMMVKRSRWGSSAEDMLVQYNPGNGLVLQSYASNTRIYHLSRSTDGKASVQVNTVSPSGEWWPSLDKYTNEYDRYEWANLTFVSDYAGKKQNVYLDGELISSTDATGKFDALSKYTALASGAIGFGGESLTLDEIKVYDKPLTANEVKEQIPPALYWSFDNLEGNVIKNLTGKSANLTPQNVTATVTEGAVNNTYKIPGNANLPATVLEKALHKAKAISFSMWLKFADETGLTKGTPYIFCERTLQSPRISLSYDGKIGITTKSNSTDSAYTTLTSNVAHIKAGDTTWHQVAGTIDFANGKITLYVDGVEVQSLTTSTYAYPYYNNAINGGTADTITLSQGNGQILMDELKWYRRALTANEVAMDYKKVYGLNVDADFTLNSDSVVASCEVANTTGKTLDVSLILGMYNKYTNELLKLDIVDVEALATDTVKSETITLSNINTPANYKYKLFAWDGVDTLKPYQLVEQYNK